MNDVSDILIILAQYLAIHNTAKRYHWQYYYLFGDHLMFDRVADEYDEKLTDKLIEQYYMGIHRDLIHETDLIVSLSTQYEGPKLPCNNMKEANELVKALKDMCGAFIEAINEVHTEIRGIDSTLDEISSHIVTCYGLLSGRLSKQEDVVKAIKKHLEE